MRVETGDRILVTEHDGRRVSYVCRVVSAGVDGCLVVLRYDTGTEEVLGTTNDREIRVLTPALPDASAPITGPRAAGHRFRISGRRPTESTAR